MFNIKSNFLLLTFCLLTLKSFGQIFPEIEVISKSQSKVNITTIPVLTYSEAPPVVIKGGWFQYYFPSSTTRNWNSPKSMVDPAVTNFLFPDPLALGGGNLTHIPLIYNDILGVQTPAAPYTYSNTQEQWRRNYNGMYAGFRLDNTVNGDVIIGINHGENKNEFIPVLNYGHQNTIHNSVIDQDNFQTFSGYVNGEYIENWAAYSGFITATWAPNTKEGNWGGNKFNELGPIVWPSQGFIDECGKKLSDGVNIPSSTVYNDSIYVYYHEIYSPPGIAPAEEEGREYGFKVARVHVDDVFNTSKFEVYYNGTWIPALPEGFTKETMMDYLAVKGPKSTKIIKDSYVGEGRRFSAAKIKGTDYFLGLEWYYNNIYERKVEFALRLSKDLVNWSNRKVILYSFENNQDFLRYPVFLNKEGDNHSEIDIEEFYIIGTPHRTNGLTIDRAKISLKLIE